MPALEKPLVAAARDRVGERASDTHAREAGDGVVGA
jgi:hypothetical protein